MSEADNIAAAATHLHGLLESKESELKEREADFARRVALFESENTLAGRDSDIIHLNVGGSTIVAVLRRTLTQFEESVLAAQFSGRWDDSLEKDRDGNVFVDQEPAHFLLLVEYLRLRMNNRSRRVPARHLPRPTYSFCYMLEYYGLMPALYPQIWRGSDKIGWEETSYGTTVLSTEIGIDPESAPIVLCNFGAFAKAGVSEFTVEFEKGTQGAVGWLAALDPGTGKGNYAAIPLPLKKVVADSIFLSITDRKLFSPDGIWENMKIDHMLSTTKIICKHDGHQEYSIEVVGASPAGQVFTATLVKEKSASHTGSFSNNTRVFPMISFNGKVTVSGLKYAIDEL